MTRRAIAVTGAAGLLGQRLLPLLDASDSVARIVGFDVRDPARRVRKLEFHRVDVTGTDLKRHLDGIDVVVHLAAIVGPIADEALMTRVNRDGTRRVLEAAASAGVRAVVRPSSAAVYGAWPNNPVPLHEDAPLRPSPGYLPAQLDAECERQLAEWTHMHPGTVATMLRIAPVVGAGAATVFAGAATGHAPVMVRGAARPVQVVHVDDASGALALAATTDLPGVYNVAADGWLAAEDHRALLPRRLALPLPESLAQQYLAALWTSGLGEVPATALPYLVHPWVVTNDRLRAAGWTPRHTNEEAILLASPGEGAGAVPWIAAVGAVLAGIAGATWWLARRHRR